jgi:hypothetical protein
MSAITNAMFSPKSAIGWGSIVAGLVLLKLVAHYDVYTMPLMTVREMWSSLPAGLKLTLTSGYLLILCGGAMLVISLVNRWRRARV